MPTYRAHEVHTFCVACRTSVPYYGDAGVDGRSDVVYRGFMASYRASAQSHSLSSSGSFCCCVCAPFILFTCNFTPQHDTIVQLSSSSLLHNDTPPHSHTHTHPRALVLFRRRRRRPLAVCARTQVTLAEALTGFTRPISLVDGRTVLFKTRDGEIVSPGAVRKLPVSGSLHEVF